MSATLLDNHLNDKTPHQSGIAPLHKEILSAILSSGVDVEDLIGYLRENTVKAGGSIEAQANVINLSRDSENDDIRRERKKNHHIRQSVNEKTTIEESKGAEHAIGVTDAR